LTIEWEGGSGARRQGPQDGIALICCTAAVELDRIAEARSDGTATTWTFDASLQLTNEWRTNPSAGVLGVPTYNSTLCSLNLLVEENENVVDCRGCSCLRGESGVSRKGKRRDPAT
jgi:hypothetical protein